MNRATVLSLTAREREVLVAYAEGLSREQVADRLGVTVSAVKATTTRMRRRLGARTTPHAVALAYQTGLMPPVHPSPGGDR